MHCLRLSKCTRNMSWWFKSASAIGSTFVHVAAVTNCNASFFKKCFRTFLLLYLCMAKYGTRLCEGQISSLRWLQHDGVALHSATECCALHSVIGTIRRTSFYPIYVDSPLWKHDFLNLYVNFLPYISTLDEGTLEDSKIRIINFPWSPGAVGGEPGAKGGQLDRWAAFPLSPTVGRTLVVQIMLASTTAQSTHSQYLEW